MTDDDDGDDEDGGGGGDDISLNQGWTYFSETYKPLENARHQKLGIKSSYVLGAPKTLVKTVQNLGTQEPSATPHDTVALSGHEFLSIHANPMLQKHLVQDSRLLNHSVIAL